MQPDQVRAAVAAMMPEVLSELAELVSHDSVSFPGFPPEPVRAAAEATRRLLTEAGFQGVRLLDVPSGYPAVYGEVPAPPGMPTVLLYAHYDVQPVPKGQSWGSDPWKLTERDGRLYGRGAADDKSGIVMHAAALRVFGGRPPVGLKVVVEGEEEAGGHLDELVAQDPALFAASAFVVADMGDLEVGAPVLTTTLRGNVVVTITVTALDHAVHSGEFGGPVPDAVMALVRILDSMVDDDGAPAIAGLDAFDWPGADYPEEELRRSSGLLDGVELIGRGSIATRLWSQPAVTVIGLDAPTLAEASNALSPRATACVSVRTAPGQDPQAALRAVTAHAHAAAPWGVRVEVSDLGAAPAFQAPRGGPAWAAARRALEDAFGVPCGEVGSGGSIPLMEALAAAAPHAEFLLFGAEDMAAARIHGGDESVDPGELERMIVAEALLLRYLAESWR